MANPAKDFIIIKNIPFEKISLNFYSTDGKLIKSIKDIQVYKNINVDIQDLQTGPYLLELLNGDNKIMFNLVVTE